MARTPLASALLAALLASSPAAAERPVPAVLALADIAEWRLAMLGRAALPTGADAKNAILVVTGGATASVSDLGQAAALAEAAGIDVINLAQRDLPAGPGALAGTGTKLVSASFTAPGSTWRSHLVIERGGKKYAVIGLASRSSVSPLPAGVRYVEPREALGKAIAEAGAVDGIIVLADAPLSQAAPWQEERPEVDAVVITGRGGGGPRVEGHPRMLRAPPGGDAIGVLPAAGKPAFAVALDPPAAPSEAYRKLSTELGLEPKLPALDRKPPERPAAFVGTELASDRLTPLGASGKNRAVVLTVRSAGILGRFAGREAAPGKKWLVLDLHFRNRLSPQVARDQVVPVAYLVPQLTDHLYLVADRVTVLRPVSLDGAAGMLSLGELKLPGAGAAEAGKLVHEIDAASPPRELTLRMYDYAHGSFVLPLLAPVAGEERPAGAPVAPLAKNEVLEIGAYGLAKSDRLGERSAPAGLVFVALDLRARSLFTTTADAAAFDPGARPGQKMQVGTVADWTDSRKYLQLVADGELACIPEPETSLDPAPRFLPDVLTGGRAVFLAPREPKSLELRCDMPNAKTPDGKVLRPRGVTLVLEGKRPPAARITKPIARIEDDVFVASVTGQATAAAFADTSAEAGKRFVVIDVTVENRGKDGETFQTLEQLQVATSDGSKVPLDPATFAGPRRPAEHVWIPAGERRSFQAAFQIETAELRPRLAYAGVSKAEVVDLARLAPEGAATAEAAATAAKAPEKEAAEMPAEKRPARSAAASAAFIEVDGKRYPSRVPVRPNLAAKGIAGVGLSPDRVNESIDRGSAFLWEHLKKEDLGRLQGTFGSYREHVLVALALVHAGYHRKDPEFDRQLRRLLEKFEANDVGYTYQVGLYAMLVEAYGDPTYLPQLRKTARWLVENQGPDGSWGYGLRQDAAYFTDPEESKALRVDGGRPLDGSDVAEPMIRLGAWEKGADGDNSVSQYALLGLHAASRSRVKSAPELWRRALEAHVGRQDEDGGWAYSGQSLSYGSMTCAGICALALATHELGGPRDPAVEERIERGLGWLSANFTVEKHPRGPPGWQHYYLYSVERVGRILDTEFIGDREWYPQGAKYLVDSQRPDGAWIGKSEEEDPRLAGSFALLFLTRATASLAEPERTGPGTLKTAVSIPPGRKVYIILDASGSMLEEMDGRPKFEIAREALAGLIRELPANAEVALRAYGYRKRAIEKDADEDSKLLVPMGKIDKPELMKIVNGLRARGKTPLAYSLEQAVRELPRGTEESPLTVLLLTDGGEDTQPRRDPIAAAAAYAALPHVRVRIVGFDIDREDWSRQLHAMAAASKGQYLPAARSDSLLRELRSAVFDVPETFAVADSTGKDVAAGKFGESVELAAGKYRVRATYAGKTFEETLWINAGTTTAVTFEARNAASDPGVGAAPGSRPAAGASPAPQPGASPKAKFCTGCGKAITPGAKFCSGCGAKLEG